MAQLRVIVTTLVVTISALGCAVSAPISKEMVDVDVVFQLATAVDGRVYRMNRKTGEVWFVEGTNLKPVSESKASRLIVGHTYLIEGNRSIRYLGEAKFSEPTKDYRGLWE